jgi:hypothetical protein
MGLGLLEQEVGDQVSSTVCLLVIGLLSARCWGRCQSKEVRGRALPWRGSSYKV